MPARLVSCLLVWTMLTACVAAAEPTPAPDRPVDFARDVRPIFAAHCYACHGPEKQESGYRLDVKSVALAAADFGEPPIVPGQSGASPLLGYVSGNDPDGIVMPPEDEGNSLTADEVALLRAWIDQGAAWPEEHAGDARLTTDHWSFQPVREIEPPLTDDPWIADPIDGFILRRLREKGLTPSPEADRVTRIRRLYLDMHGLPPTPEELASFIADDRPEAWADLVERVLASPRYGERWARHWLDVVRFAESNGFETNHERVNAWPYRDYVIAALNADKPYDRFVVEQLAGDAVGADVATGFLVAGPYDVVKSPDVNLTLMQRQDELADMVNTTGTALLGLTFGCARCHSHKFDPIPQKDYYALQAVFAGVQHGEREIRREPQPGDRARLAEIEAELATAQGALDALGLREPVNAKQNTERFAPVTARIVRFTVLATNSSEPCLDELEIYAVDKEAATDGDDSPRNVALAAAGAIATSSGDYQGNPKHKLEHIHDGQYGNPRSWISNEQGGGWVQIELAEPATIDRIVWGRDRSEQFADRLATRYRIEVALEPGRWQLVASSDDRLPPGADATQVAADRSPEERDRINKLLAEVAALRQERARLVPDAGPKAYVGTFRQPGATHRLHRGDPMAKREEVAPDALTVTGSLGLETTTPEQQRRLALARWIAAPDNPLTARVIVNRLWHYHFGTGLVDTPSDFGANGTPPSHPELLDWLAAELVRGGWSLKHVHRLILNSAAYRQSSRPRKECIAVDSDSRLLWRFPPRRLEAEAIRDCTLAVTGTIVLEMGGRGFVPFEVQMENVRHYFPKKSFGPAEWRRMVYMTKIRQEQDDTFGAFDCPDGNQVMPRRSRSTTPLQALNLLNSGFILQQADLWAERLKKEAGAEAAAQVARAFQLAFGRDPDKAELSDALTLIDEHGLESFCRAMLNANEFLFIP